MELTFRNLFFHDSDKREKYQPIKLNEGIYTPNPLLSNFFADLLFLSYLPSLVQDAQGKEGGQGKKGKEEVEIFYVFGNSPNQQLNDTQIVYVRLLAQLFPAYSFRVIYSVFPIATGLPNLMVETSPLSSPMKEGQERGKVRVLITAARISKNYLEILEAQKNWIAWTQPDIAFTLMKLPYSNNPENIKEVMYYDGYMMKEIWGTRENTETRILSLFNWASSEAQLNKLRSYQVIDYEEMLAAHNRVRMEQAFNNPNSEFSKFIDPNNGLKNDFDSRATVEIISLYLYNLGKAYVTNTNVLKFFNFITTELQTTLHNKLMLKPVVMVEYPEGDNDIGLADLGKLAPTVTGVTVGAGGVGAVTVGAGVVGAVGGGVGTSPIPVTTGIGGQLAAIQEMTRKTEYYTINDLAGRTAKQLKNILQQANVSTTLTKIDQLKQLIVNAKIPKR